MPSHEKASHEYVARGLATLLSGDYGGRFEECLGSERPLYIVPNDTLIGLESAQQLGIRNHTHFFGGVVPNAWMATKIITHPLVQPGAPAPPQWIDRFSELVAPVVLPGFSAFSRHDAEVAGRRLLRNGPVRFKPVRATAGRGQIVFDTPGDHLHILQSLDENELGAEGVVLETHLDDINTYSVGQVTVGNMLISYCGTQSLTLDNRAEQVYGGSRLFVVRGGFDDLLKMDVAPDMRDAVQRAQVYDAAAFTCFDGLLASRRNYDVAAGRDAKGHVQTGVLEQSWRIGGASGAEVAALLAFRADPHLHAVHSACFEVYGESHLMPAQAALMFCGLDEEVGFITKYTMVD